MTYGGAPYGRLPYGGGTLGPTDQTIALGHITETTTVHALTATVEAVVNLGHVSETTTVYGLTVVSGTLVNLGHITETTTVHGLTVVAGAVVQIGHITETTTLYALTPTTGEQIALGHVTETTTVYGLTVGYGYGRTDDTNTAGGYRFGAYATAIWSPPVEPAPAGTILAEDYPTTQAFSTVTMNGAQPVYTVQTKRGDMTRDRLVVGGKDVTWFRGKPTPLPDFQLVEPLMYGVATLTFPQIAAAFENPGSGVLSWLKRGKVVKVQRVDTDGNIVATDYKGIVVAFDTSGQSLTVQVGGEASGRFALRYKPVPIFASYLDGGRLIARAFNEINVDYGPRLGPVTGIKLGRFGGTGMLDYVSQIHARMWTRSGNQWTTMPGANGRYHTARKDTTTIDGTVYADGSATVANLRRDTAEEPNRIYATGVTPNGERVRFGVYPGLTQGIAPDFPGLLSEGDEGTEVNLAIGRLQIAGYLNRRDQPGGYDEEVTEAVEEFQEDAELAVTGNINDATWRALWDLDATGFSLAWSHQEPAAQKSRVRKWIRGGSGAIIRKNPNYDPHALKVDRDADMGAGFKRSQMRKWARAEIDVAEDNWVGTIDFKTGGLVLGDHTPGAAITEADVMPARDLRPGMNLSLPLFAGGITVHVSGVTVNASGVTALVDTRARDAMPAWEVVQRNRESRRDPARMWVREHRQSGEIKDAVVGFDEVGGVLSNDIAIERYNWYAFPVAAGQAGQVAKLRIRTEPAAEIYYVVAGHSAKDDGSDLAANLESIMRDPDLDADRANWRDEDKWDRLDAKHSILVFGGEPDAPGGYYPGSKDEDDPLTGRTVDDSAFTYYSETGALWVAVWADRNCTIQAGRVLWNQLEGGV